MIGGSEGSNKLTSKYLSLFAECSVLMDKQAEIFLSNISTTIFFKYSTVGINCIPFLSCRLILHSALYFIIYTSTFNTLRFIVNSRNVVKRLYSFYVLIKHFSHCYLSNLKLWFPILWKLDYDIYINTKGSLIPHGSLMVNTEISTEINAKLDFTSGNSKWI